MKKNHRTYRHVFFCFWTEILLEFDSGECDGSSNMDQRASQETICSQIIHVQKVDVIKSQIIKVQ